MPVLHYAGIGTRNPIDEQRELCRKIGRYMAAKGWVLHSGGAAGCDNEFTLGAALQGIAPQVGRVRIHLPWDQYNADLSLHASRFPERVRISVLDPNDGEAFASVQLHPAAATLDLPAIKLHARNYRIIKPNDSTTCMFVVALPSDKLGGGETGQGIRIAESLNIPVVRLDQRTPDKVKAIIDALIQAAQQRSLECVTTLSQNVLDIILPLPAIDVSLRTSIFALRKCVCVGTVCPCCGQPVEFFKLKFDAAMARQLCMLAHEHRRFGDHWLKLIFDDTQASILSKLSRWKLVELQQNDVDASFTGYGRATLRGTKFAFGELQVPDFCFVYNGTVVQWSGTLVSIDGFMKQLQQKELNNDSTPSS